MSLLASHIDECIAALEAEKRAKKKENVTQALTGQEAKIPLSALKEGAKVPFPSADSVNAGRTLSLPVRDDSVYSA